MKKPYSSGYNLLIVQDLWQTHYQILSIILLKEFIKLKCGYKHDDERCEICRMTHKYCDCFLEYTNFKDDLVEYKCLCCNKNYQKKFMKSSKNDLLIHTHFLTMIPISLLYCCEKVFNHTNTWMIGKNWIKDHYLKKKILHSPKYGRHYSYRLNAQKKRL